jgi:uncharacterized membrane protein YvbJ
MQWNMIMVRPRKWSCRVSRCQKGERVKHMTSFQANKTQRCGQFIPGTRRTDFGRYVGQYVSRVEGVDNSAVVVSSNTFLVFSVVSFASLV